MVRGEPETQMWVSAHAANQEAKAAWEENAAQWDARMGEGNDFVELLLWPAVEHLLDVRPGQRVLDIACGNGLTSRRLAALGAQVLAFDFSEAMIAAARRRTEGTPLANRIEYRVLDATDADALRSLGARCFDAALCNMALFDMAEIAPLAQALARLLAADGPFVFSVLHPCFNGAGVVHLAEQEDCDGQIVERYAVKISAYLTPVVRPAAAMRGQQRPQPLFHRPLHALLAPFFVEGFVVDALQEPGFPPTHPPGAHPLAWSGRFSEIPPVMVVRARLRA